MIIFPLCARRSERGTRRIPKRNADISPTSLQIRLELDCAPMMCCAYFSIGSTFIMKPTLRLSERFFQSPGATRYEIWSQIFGELPREDSAEADLFRLLIRDLSTGGVIRQERDVNQVGQFVRKKPPARRPATKVPTTLESAFEETKPYVLTELGKQFVHYTMNEVVTRIRSDAGEHSA
jgi:hypothetical protein